MTHATSRTHRTPRFARSALAAALSLTLGAAPGLLAPPAAAAQNEVLADVVAPTGDKLTYGLSLRVYRFDQAADRVPELVPGQTANVNRRIDRLDLQGARGDFGGPEDFFLTHLDGYLRVTEPGRYRFEIASDDGSWLTIGGEVVVDHDGLHGMTARAGERKLEAGLHELKVRHFEAGGDAGVRLRWQPPGAEGFEAIPLEHLLTPADEVRVTSPGVKRVIPAGGSHDDRPGHGLPLAGLHPSYTVTPLHRPGFEPLVGGIDFLSDGRMVLCTWDPTGGVYVLSNVTASDPAEVGVQRIAAGLAEPLGLKVVDDRIFVLQKQELTELIDHDGDGLTDEYRVVASGWPVSDNFHEFAFGLAYLDGFFYANLAVAIDPGGGTTNPQVPGRGSTIRIDPDTGKYEVIAAGLRTPNGIGLGPDNEVLVTDNQGDWLPSSKLLHIRPGKHYGSHIEPPGPFDHRPETPPVVWLPHGEIGNSPSQVVTARHGPYAGQVLHGDVTHGGIKRTSLDRVDGQLQGAVFRFTQGLHAGVNRLAYGPDDALYVGGIGSGGNWGQAGKARYGLERLEYTGQPAFEMLSIRALTNGFEVRFTEPLADDYEPFPSHFLLQRFRYEPTASYGGPKVDLTRHGIESASLSPDRTRLVLVTDPLLAGHVYYLRLQRHPIAASGRELWSSEAWYTMNRVPSGRIYVPPTPEPHNTLSAQDKADGWRLLFDGQTAGAWRGFKKPDLPDGWVVDNGQLHRAGPGGDIITREQFENFELSLEWRIGPGGNSGIFFRVSEEHDAVWATGPEMQILDNTRHADGGSPLTSAGANYALHPPARDVTRPIGQYNHARLVVRGNHVEHHLNGVKLLEYELGGPQWQQLVADSKFADLPDYGRVRVGHIALQDHGDPVWFRNIKIRPLD